MKRLLTILLLLLAATNIWAQDDGFDPPSPPVPYANVFNPTTGELFISSISRGDNLDEAAYLAFKMAGFNDVDKDEIRSVVINCALGEEDFEFFNDMENCVSLDLHNMTGVRVLPQSFCSQGMDRLERIILPAEIEELECTLRLIMANSYYVFANLTQLRQLTVYAPYPPKVPADFLTRYDHVGGTTMLNRGVTIAVPQASLEAYRAADVWKNYNIVAIESGEAKPMASATIVVTTPDGENVTDEVNIRWTNPQGVELATGDRISEIAEGEQAMYVMTLPYEMTLDYQTPTSGTVTGDGEDHIIRLTLNTWPFNAFKGTTVAVAFDLAPVEGFSGNMPTLIGGDDLTFRLKDLTTGESIDDFQYDGARLKLTQFLPAGHTLEVTVESRSHLFRTATERVTTHYRGGSDVVFHLVENGRTVLNYDIVAETEYMCLVSTPDGMRVTSVRSKEGSFNIGNLPDGSYKAYVLYYDASNYNIPDVTALYKSNESSSYCTIVDITSEAGREGIYDVKVPSKPLVVNRYGGYVSVGKTELSLGERIDAVIGANLGSGISGVSDERMIIEMSEGMSYVEGSLFVRQGDVSLSLTGQRLYVTGSNVVTCSFVGDTPGTHTINIYMEYVKGGLKTTEFVTSREFTIDNLTIGAPGIAYSGKITVSGNAQPGALVTVYDDDQRVGEIYTKLNGEWDLPVELDETLPFHALTAEFVNERDVNVKTDPAFVHIAPTAPVLKRIMMYNGNTAVEFDPIKGKVTPNYYSYNPSEQNLFTFIAEMTNLDPKAVAVPMFVVTTSDDMTYLLKATYDASAGGYTTCCGFKSSLSVPEYVDFTFDYVDPEYTRQLAEYMAAQATASNMATMDQARVAMEEDIEIVEVLREEEKMTEALLRFKSTDEYFLQRLQEEDFDAMQSLMATEGLILYGYRCDGDSVVNFIIDSEEESLIYYVDLDEQFAFSVRYAFCDANGAPLPVPDAGQSAMLRGQHRAIPIIAAVGVVTGIITVLSHTKEMYKLAHSHYEWRLSQMQNRRNDYANRLHAGLSSVNAALSACCANGKFKVGNLYGTYSAQFHDYASKMSDFMNKYDKFVEEYQKSRDNAVKSEFGNILVDAILTACGGKLVGMGLKGAGRVLALVRKIAGSSNASAFNDLVASGIQTTVLENLPDSDKDYNDVYDQYSKWLPQAYNDLLGKINSLYESIIGSYQECSDGELEREVISVDKNYTSKKKSGTRRRRVRPIIDPSGYVYEGVEANRVEGVTATIYYRESEEVSEDEAVLWQAEDYGQKNPLVTGADGFYRWDVPGGLWQVRFHKAGYEDVSTEWLPVPPPQLDVNMPMKQTAAPDLSEAAAYTDGVAFEFTKYMDVSSVEQNTTVSVLDRRIDGKVEALDAEASPAGRSLAKHYRFTSLAPIEEKVVTLQVGASTTDYADVQLQHAAARQLTVQHAIEGLTVQPLVNAPIGQQVSFLVKATPAVAVEGKPLTVAFAGDAETSPFARLDATTVIFDGQGTARVGLVGLLPGVAELNFSIADKTAQTNVDVFYDLSAIQSPLTTSPLPLASDIYDLSGRRVTHFKALTKGFYIIGGRKVMK